MINAKRLAEWKRGSDKWHSPSRQELGETFDTLEAALRVVEAAKKFHTKEYRYDGDWEIREALAPFRGDEAGREKYGT